MSFFASYPSLTERSVLIIGGASRVGAAFVEHFAQQRTRAAFVDVAATTNMLASLADAAHLPHYVHCDITELDALGRAIDATRRLVGSIIGALANNATNDSRMCTGQNFIVDGGWV
ncbi:MAG: NAD-dependent epimerase/dehydratase family protein [Rhodanobacter sp.]